MRLFVIAIVLMALLLSAGCVLSFPNDTPERRSQLPRNTSEPVPREGNVAVEHADLFPGSDASAKIAAAIARLPARGGMVDARGLEGSQRWSFDPFTGTNKAVTLLIGSATHISTVEVRLPSNARILGMGHDRSELRFEHKGSEPLPYAIFIQQATGAELSGLKIGAAEGSARKIIVVSGGSGVRLHGNHIYGASVVAGTGPIAGLAIQGGATDVWVTENTFSGNGGSGPTADASYDVVVWPTPPVCQRIRIRDNHIGGSNTSTSIALYNARDSDVTGNVVDQNNRIEAGADNDGYGILLYGTDEPPTRVVVERNVVRNTAGSAIYAVTVSHVTIAHNHVSGAAQQQDDSTLPVAGIALNDASQSRIAENRVEVSGRSGIVVAAPSDGIAVIRNEVLRTESHGIQLRGSLTDVTVRANLIADAGGEAMRVSSHLTQASIEANFMRNGSRHGMVIDALSQGSIRCNAFDSVAAGYRAVQVDGGTQLAVLDNVISTDISSPQLMIQVSGTEISVDGNVLGPFSLDAETFIAAAELQCLLSGEATSRAQADRIQKPQGSPLSPSR